ncbi:MAG TPA: mannose-1-phosphate guanylyltransferase/mannose-6-phosphate isomerase [Nitrospirales bacterium]|nr:mannose-1-phosphate guanylyltransferase/mannose-6-phosphate isomerase [Nitrospirales bacterium]
MNIHSHLHAIILAGGSGTRFWPLSRELYPKQLLHILGDQTLIQQTLKRTLSCVPTSRTFIVTNRSQADMLSLQLREWKRDIREHIIVEPEGRNTAPAIAMAAVKLVAQDPDAVMLVLPADHVIKGTRKFTEAVKFGTTLAGDGHLVTLGIRPTVPEIGYGYIKPNMRQQLGTQGALKGYRVRQFLEKPDRAKAKTMLRSGGYFWNSGIFLWKASTILDELSLYQPGLLRVIRKLCRLQDDGAGFKDNAMRMYGRLSSMPIDTAVMEQTSKAVVVPVDFGWSDIGSWSALGDVASKTKAGNVINGNIIDLGSENSVLFGNHRLVATIGLKDMVLVDTPDATLVCPKSRAQDVKGIVDILKKRKAPERVEHQTVFRPWGSYTTLDDGAGYKVKRLTVRPGAKLSLQRHRRRREHWVVVRGKAKVIRGDQRLELTIGQSLDIPQAINHRIENPWSETLEIIEVQHGSYLGEDDIVRLQDIYGREVRS